MNFNKSGTDVTKYKKFQKKTSTAALDFSHPNDIDYVQQEDTVNEIQETSIQNCDQVMEFNQILMMKSKNH